MSKTNLAKVLAVALIVGGALLLALRTQQQGPLRIGDSAPDFTLPSIDRGSLSLRDFRQRVVVLNFWASWCPPCIAETPSLEKFARRIRGLGVEVIGVSVDQDGTALRNFVAGSQLSFPIARDPEQAVASRYGTFKFPETYIIDRDGRIVEKIVGAIDWQDPRILNFVQKLARPDGHTGQ